MSKPSILINILLYYPDKNKILELIRICLNYEQVKNLLFDNAPSTQSLEFICSEKIILYKSTKNVGVAGAHYYACKMAEAENFNFLLFLDQDSQLPPDFILHMILGFYQLQKLYPRLCAIGPSWKDPRILNWDHQKVIKENFKTKVKIQLKAFLKIRQQKEKIHNLLRLDHILISSGMLIWMPTLKKIGYPKKEYFIDLVDIEWFLRALSKNYQIEILKTVQMRHAIGEFKASKKNFLLYQNPTRYYYSIRNSFYLFRENQFPFSFRLFILIRNIMEN